MTRLWVFKNLLTWCIPGNNDVLLSEQEIKEIDILCVDEYYVYKYTEDLDLGLLYLDTLEKSIREATITLAQEGVKENIKMVGIKAKKAAQKLLDIEKRISDKIDSTIDKLQDNIDKERTEKNREAIIKGRVCPQASALLKLILGSGALSLLINPALGLITFLSGIALSKKSTEKERQYIMDEIEVELKMVEKEMSLAESNNDLKAVRKLLILQKKLRREKQRILYKGRARNFDRNRD